MSACASQFLLRSMRAPYIPCIRRGGRCRAGAMCCERRLAGACSLVRMAMHSHVAAEWTDKRCKLSRLLQPQVAWPCCPRVTSAHRAAGATSGKLGPLVGENTMLFPADGDFIGRISQLGGALVFDSVSTYAPVAASNQLKMTIDRLDIRILGKTVRLCALVSACCGQHAGREAPACAGGGWVRARSHSYVSSS